MRNPNPYGMDLAQPWREQQQRQDRLHNHWLMAFTIGFLMGAILVATLAVH